MYVASNVVTADELVVIAPSAVVTRVVSAERPEAFAATPVESRCQPSIQAQ